MAGIKFDNVRVYVLAPAGEFSAPGGGGGHSGWGLVDYPRSSLSPEASISTDSDGNIVLTDPVGTPRVTVLKPSGQYTPFGVVVESPRGSGYNQFLLVTVEKYSNIGPLQDLEVSYDPSIYAGPTTGPDPACFLSGSLIRTVSGDVAVEDIRAGDEIIAYVDGKETVRPVTWTGMAQCNVRPGVPDDLSGLPVRILKDAIADGVPSKDMLITAEHCLFLNGKFIPARMLVNGRSIFCDRSFTSYDYYHIETKQHSVIMADGMLTESYLDTGNRAVFRQEGNIIPLTPSRNLSWDDAAAPLGVSREFAEPVFRQIEARAMQAQRPVMAEPQTLSHEHNLHLITDTGVVLRPVHEDNGQVQFSLPADAQSVRIVSSASRPSDVTGPFVDDRRYFGVAVGSITLSGNGETHAVTAHLTDRDLRGWNAPEWEDTRWTSGNALLPLGHRMSGNTALLTLQIKAAGPYLLGDTITEKHAATA